MLRSTPISRARRGLIVCLGMALGTLGALVGRPLVAHAADLSISCSTDVAFEGEALNHVVATITDVDGDVAANFTSGTTINWGDGAMDTGTATVISTSSTTFNVQESHTYAEEGTFTVSVSVTDADGTSGSASCSDGSIAVTDAPLLDPTTAASPMSFAGMGGTNTSVTPGTANAALNAFASAIGGVQNTAPSPQSGGFRKITWDGVKVDGTDFGGNTTVITPGHTVGIPVNRFRGSGADLGAVYAVSNDGFADVNPAAAGLFPAFSPVNVFSSFNDNTVELNFVRPASPTSASVPAATRGFGAIFIDVEAPNTSSIEYFNGTTSLGKIFAPAGGSNTPVFLGELFGAPIVTRVVITGGTAQIFNFDGTTTTPGPAEGVSTDLAALDDFVYAEPNVMRTTVSAATPFNGTLISFPDADPNGNVGDYTAVIDWGDGTTSAGTIAAGSGGQFTVSGTHTFASGVYNADVSVADFGGATRDFPLMITATPATTATALGASTSSATIGQAVTLTATVTPGSGIIPMSGTVTFTDGSTTLGSAALPGSGSGPQTISVATSSLAPGPHTITATYGGDTHYTGSSSAPVMVFVKLPPLPTLPTIGPLPGFWMAGRDGSVYPFGAATPLVSIASLHRDSPGLGRDVSGLGHLNQPIVGIAALPDGSGYWLVAGDGGVFPFGNAKGYGSLGGVHLNKPVVGIAATRDGSGYWLVAADGGIFPFGSAKGFGSLGGVHLNKPIVGMTSSFDGGGYWLVAADGGIFPFGNAAGFGSTGGMHLNQPIVGMARSHSGLGYWLVASDGGIFPFGDATGFGSTGGIHLNKPIVGMSVTPDGGGYWLVASDGGTFPFGDAPGLGSLAGMTLPAPIVGTAPSRLAP